MVVGPSRGNIQRWYKVKQTVDLNQGQLFMYLFILIFLQGIHVYVVVQIDPWFKLYFLLFQNLYHALPYPKTKENKI